MMPTINATPSHIKALASRLNTEDNRPAASLETVSFDRLNKLAGTPLQSGFFTPVHTIVAPSMAGRGGEAFGLAGFQFASLSTLLRSCHPRLTARGGDLTPKLEAYTMPKHAHTFLTYTLVATVTLTIERNTHFPVIALAIAALVLLQVIGGANHA